MKAVKVETSSARVMPCMLYPTVNVMGQVRLRQAVNHSIYHLPTTVGALSARAHTDAKGWAFV
jgi:hypothetical protein